MFAAACRGVNITTGVTMAYGGSATNTGNASTYTFLDASIGSASSARQVLILIASSYTPTSTPFSVYTVSLNDGSGTFSATPIVDGSVGQIATEGGTACLAYIVPSSFGTAASITVNFSGVQLRCTITTYALYGSFTPVAFVQTRQEVLGGGITSLPINCFGLWDYGPAVAQVCFDKTSTSTSVTGELSSRLGTTPENSDTVVVSDTALTTQTSFTTTTSLVASNVITATGFAIVFLPRVEPTPFTATISSNQISPNLATIATAQGWNGTQALQVTINSGVTVAALSVSQTFPGGLHIVNNGNIYGYRADYNYSGGGEPGGPAISATVPLRITNNGNIWGGGGSGGVGGDTSIYGDQTSESSGNAYGGHGQGLVPGTVTIQTNTIGQSGFTVYLAEPNDPYWWGFAQGGSGGSGGAWGMQGQAGFEGYGEGAAVYTNPGGAGGAAGPSLTGSTYASWMKIGSRKGPLV